MLPQLRRPSRFHRVLASEQDCMPRSSALRGTTSHLVLDVRLTVVWMQMEDVVSRCFSSRFKLFGHQRRGAEEGNQAIPQFLEQFNTRGVGERNVRKIQGQPDPVAESVQIARSPELLDPAFRQTTFYPEFYRLA